MTASTLTLTPVEAKVIHEALANAWAPSQNYAIYLAAMKKLEAMSTGATEEAPTHRRNHRGS